MKFEWYSAYDLYFTSSQMREVTVDHFVGKEQKIPQTLADHARVRDPMARLMLLTQLAATPQKDYARVGRRNKPSGLLHLYEDGDFEAFLRDQVSKYIRGLALADGLPDISGFPPASWYIQFTFNLRKPYISRDDTDFCIIDNPVKKEWVFKVPYVAPTQWKGVLRAAMTRQLAEEKDSLSSEKWLDRRLQLARLFGNEKGVALDDESFEEFLDKQHGDLAQPYRKRLRSYTITGLLAGCLHFYPTYFDRIGLEVINPHQRDTGAGKQPLYFECVPQGTQGNFCLLYVPIYPIGKGGTGTRRQAMVDFESVVVAIRAMMTTNGFGAKTSSGFGVAEEEVKGGRFVLNVPEQPEKAIRPEKPEPPEVIRKIRIEFPDEDFTLKPNAWREKHKASRVQRETYKQARAAFTEYQKALKKYETALKVRDTSVKAPPPKTERTFMNFEDLIKQTQMLFEQKHSKNDDA